MKESDIMRYCILEASKHGARLWRNNVGAFKDARGAVVKFGLCNPGGADLIGIYNGKFLAIEVKQPDKNPTPEQRNFLEFIRKSGGLAGIARHPSDVKKILDGEVIL